MSPPAAHFAKTMNEANDQLDDLNIDGLEWRLEIVPLDDVYLDKYQRPLDENWITKRLDDFKPWLLGTITVSERHNKAGLRFALVDGQHRRELGMRHNITHLPAVVFYGLSMAEEAGLFSSFQRERRNITPLQRFNADLVSGDPRAKSIVKMLTEEHFQVSDYIAPQNIKAVSAIEALYEKDPALLRQTLRLIYQCWQDMPYNTALVLLRGLDGFLVKTPDLDEQRFVDRLGSVTPSVLLDRSAKLREGRGAVGALPSFMTEVINDVYRTRAKR